jgi:hypothetical protein
MRAAQNWLASPGLASAAIDATGLTQINYKPISCKLTGCVRFAQYPAPLSDLSCWVAGLPITNGGGLAALR